jgi:transglutaminase-like putative cysteine protease
MNARVLCLIVLLTASALARAEKGNPVDLQVRYGRVYSSYLLNEDGTATETHEWSMTVLKDSALEWAKRRSISYSTSAQQAEVVEAYTLKPDGRRIDVPKDNYQIEINRGRGNDSPVYSDRSTTTVVFPDVAVGDTIAISYRLIQTDPLFPKHFSVAQSLSPRVAYDDLRVRFEYPASMWVQYAARGMEQIESGEKNGRKVVAWRYANPNPAQDERRNFSVYDPDREFGIAFSTFHSYEEIAAAYGARALPKAAVTDRIRKLAADIVKDTHGPRDQARLLYEWVAKNITYAGNCIGIGAVVPRDAAFILDNKMGDCKDHATLLQALLTARGIESTQALINAGSVYRLPKVPVVSTVNHVINYLPAFDLYVDSTSDSTPFGMLPFADQDKPVLLVQGFKPGSKTPASPVGANRQQTRSVLKLKPDGSVSGSVEVVQRGEPAVASRGWARMLSPEREADLVKNMFLQQGMIGSGTFEKDDATGLIDTYRYKADFNVEKFVKASGSGAFYIDPVLRSAGSIGEVLNYSLEPETDADTTCSNGTMIEEYDVELPAKMKVLSVPDDLKVTSAAVDYRATYELHGNRLRVRRELDDRTPGNVCPPEVMARYKEFGEKVMDDLKAQVLYKWKAD